ncbi:TPA: M24 family metallopeptidase, partial [Candidatus Woesearchaeota archaeon]|nr:M24 family metallopeptidase [Candidatus Woesearchaeota archaeon]
VPGRPFFDIDQYAKKMLGTFGRFMNHSIGHGLGFDCHEFPAPRKKGDFSVLEEGSVVTIEPGVYLPRRGGMRIEDDVLVPAKGPQVLTKTGKNLLVIKR